MERCKACGQEAERLVEGLCVYCIDLWKLAEMQECVWDMQQ